MKVNYVLKIINNLSYFLLGSKWIYESWYYKIAFRVNDLKS
jgi:hypothetical protein